MQSTRDISPIHPLTFTLTYKIKHCFFFLFCFPSDRCAGTRTARIASSNTFLSPFCLFCQSRSRFPLGFCSCYPICASRLSSLSHTSCPLNRLSCSVEPSQTKHLITTLTVLILIDRSAFPSCTNSLPTPARRALVPRAFPSYTSSVSSIPLPTQPSSQSYSASLDHGDRLNHLRFTTSLQILYSSHLPSAPSSHCVRNGFKPPLP